MAKPRPGMGRGLEAILSVSAQGETPRAEELRDVAVSEISPNPRQPRRRFDPQTLEQLAASLSERGVLQPVLVRPKRGGGYELVAGERRWRAAQIAGMKSIPAIVRQREDAVALELALIENMAREDLNPVDEARACAALVEELGLTREQVGRRVGRGRVAVSNLVRLLDLPDEVLELLQEGRLSEGHGRALLLTDDHARRKRLAVQAVEEGWSVRETEGRARQGNVTARVAPRRGGSGGAHPDQEQAASEIAETLAGAFGAEVRVRPTSDGRYRAELSFSSPQEAIELADRIRPRSTA